MRYIKIEVEISGSFGFRPVAVQFRTVYSRSSILFDYKLIVAIINTA